jgi:hypothetical protein
MLTKKEKQTKKKDSMDVDDESLDMNVFLKLMEGKHKEIVSNDTAWNGGEAWNLKKALLAKYRPDDMLIVSELSPNGGYWWIRQ